MEDYSSSNTHSRSYHLTYEVHACCHAPRPLDRRSRANPCFTQAVSSKRCLRLALSMWSVRVQIKRHATWAYPCIGNCSSVATIAYVLLTVSRYVWDDGPAGEAAHCLGVVGSVAPCAANDRTYKRGIAGWDLAPPLSPFSPQRPAMSAWIRVARQTRRTRQSLRGAVQYQIRAVEV
jgi:hypothetical protein